MARFIRNAVLNGYVELVRTLGGDPLALLSAVGLDDSHLSAHNAWIPIDAVVELFELSAAATGCDDFGLRLGEGRRLSNLGPISLAAREEPDIRSVLTMIMRYQHLHNEALRSRLTESNGLACVQVELDLSHPQRSRQAIELLVGALLRYLRNLIGDGWCPVAVRLTHDAPPDTAGHHRALGPHVRFGQADNAIVLYAGDLDAPNTLADPLLRPFARQYLESIASPRSTAEVERVKDLIEALLPSGRCSLKHVAQSLRVDRKTVHRHLAASGETFSSVLNSTRVHLAKQYVEHQGRPLTEVAELLGFASLSTFSRWFRDEFGTSPRTWRAERRREGNGAAAPPHASHQPPSRGSAVA
ncbi:AraC family transcriptional regulator [Streptomyces sp. NPDC004561]